MPPLRMLWLRLLLLSCGLILASITLAAPVAIPELRTQVTDLSNTLSQSEQQQLEEKLHALEQAKGSQLAVLIVPTTGEETIEQYGIRVVEKWQLGRKGVDDGVLLLIAKNDRTVRIEVGRGLEGVLPDVVASRIIREIMVPAFKTGDWAGGIQAGVAKMSALIQGEALPAPTDQRMAQQSSDNELPFILLVPLLIFGGFLRHVLGFLASFILTSLIASLGLIYFGLSIPIALGIGAVLGLIVSSKSGGVISSGQGHWGGGSSGGGFSGGGGGFGGGGASGRW
ncbi:YgcG family protein [Chitinibacter fontanus]|uniref:YgcG family protein n=1 Tax=Chitinibacter fontanus TaxID=1737446 RepID=A0A7D5Z5U6_9NEIS|nr:YgcG family protein [Chitinibacter fontanus]QLI81002.1 YgcG family protein [Chitinibacter fontanus]